MTTLPFPDTGRNVAGAAPPRAPSPGSPLDKPLIDAVQAHGLRTRGLAAQQVTVCYSDGSAVTIPVPIGSATTPPPFWPRPDGWDFRPGEAAFDGVAFKLTGRAMAALRVLADRPGCPVPVARLFRDVWQERAETMDPSAVHALLSSVRRALRAALGIGREVDPIPHSDGAYTLTVGAADATREAA